MRRRWPLILEQEGYAAEEIDINPRREPEAATTSPIFVVAFMRAQPSR